MDRKQAEKAIQQGLLGEVLPQRIELVRRVHEVIDTKLASGGSVETAKTQIKMIERFFRWAELAKGVSLDVNTVQTVYLRWSEHLFHRNKVSRDQSAYTVYNGARCVGQVLDAALGRPTPMIELTRVREPKGPRKPIGAKADKQHLEKTFAFGQLLQDLCDGLSLKVVWGPRPVRIQLRDGGQVVRWMASRLRTPEQYLQMSARKARISAASNLEYENTRSLSSRASLINSRVLAEMLMFIGQTGMNLAQASQLLLYHFSYSSDIDGYKVRDYKARRGGEVLFEIFTEYRSHFERYLEWRRSLFPDEMRLFPLIRRGAHPSHRPSFELIQDACEQAGVTWTPPSVLRGTRINWLLRRSGDADLTADLAQHHKKTLLRVYEVPSQQRAIAEITRFWQSNDPILAGRDQTYSVAPGACDGVPQESAWKPVSAPSPDCARPSGCLWCEHHRDIDSFEYVWALSCFRHLKILELSSFCPPSGQRTAEHPAEHGIRRLSEKLAWFRDSNAARREWVEESLARVEEGYYHREWAFLIQSVEGVCE